MNEMHILADQLFAGLENIKASPKSATIVDVIARRPAVGARELPEMAELHEVFGLIGDTWSKRGSSRTPDGGPHPDMQLTIMNSRAIALIAETKDRWALAGDQLYMDLDLSVTNLPPGSRLKIGEAIVEITAQPHLGCAKFKARFGADAVAFVNSPIGRELRLRGVNARIVAAGRIRVGDRVEKLRQEGTDPR
jgi:hypothetical protein